MDNERRTLGASGSSSLTTRAPLVETVAGTEGCVGAAGGEEAEERDGGLGGGRPEGAGGIAIAAAGGAVRSNTAEGAASEDCNRGSRGR